MFAREPGPCRTAPIALAAALAAAALTTTPRPALALSDPVLSADDGSGGSTVCGQGKTVECGSTTTYKCTSWVLGVTVGPTGLSYTPICASYISQVSKSYKD